MRTSALLALLTVVTLWDTASSQVADEVPVSNRDAYRVIAGCNRNFTNALYEILSRTEGNVFFSPLSIQTVLALASQGAIGTTQAEMITGLKLPQDQQLTRVGFSQLFNLIKKNNADTVKIANKIYTDRRFPPTGKFLQIAQNCFHSDGQQVNFTRPNEARQIINQWVEENTGNKIHNLIAEGSLTPDTAMVLVNAVYFKGTWITQFNPTNTLPKPFYVSDTITKEVQMIHVKVRDKFFYKSSTELGAQILEIPYVGHTVSLVIILPNEKGDLPNVESKLANMDMKDLFTQMSKPTIRVELPKFKMEQSIELTDALSQMGMRQMFTDQANFTALTTQGPVKVSKVVHKAFIDVNEEGAEAAAATAVQFVYRSFSREYIEHFKADHPFIFFLVSSESGNYNGEKIVLFMGRYSGPP